MGHGAAWQTSGGWKMERRIHPLVEASPQAGWDAALDGTGFFRRNGSAVGISSRNGRLQSSGNTLGDWPRVHIRSFHRAELASAVPARITGGSHCSAEWRPAPPLPCYGNRTVAPVDDRLLDAAAAADPRLCFPST